MKKKKRNRPKKLTDEEYDNYIMAMKDEEPPVLIRKTEGEN